MSFEEKLTKDKRHIKDYKDFMKKIIAHHNAKKVKDAGVKNETSYIPHHGIYNPKKQFKKFALCLIVQQGTKAFPEMIIFLLVQT